MAILEVKKGPDAGKVFPLPTCHEGVVIGRDPENAIALSDARASRRNSRISFVCGEWIIEDLRSSNGTFVRGKRVEKTTIETGAAIQIGVTLLLFDAERLPDLSGRLELVETTIRRTVRESSGVFVLAGYQSVLDREVRVDWVQPSRPLGSELRARLREAFRQAFELRELGFLPLVEAECGEEGEETFALFKGAVLPSLAERLDEILRLPLELRLQVARQIVETLFRRSSVSLLGSPVGLPHIGIEREGSEAPMVVLPPIELSAFVGEGTGDLPHLPDYAQYLPPEYLAPASEIRRDAAAAYNSAAIAYHVLTGRKPCGEGSLKQVLERQRDLRPAPPNLLVPELPEDLSRALERMLEKAPEKRLSDPNEVLEAFARAGAQLRREQPAPPRRTEPTAAPEAARTRARTPPNARTKRTAPPAPRRAMALPFLALAAAALFFLGRYLSKALLRALGSP